MARAARDGVSREVADAIAGIGVSSPGPVDPRTGYVVEPPNLGPRFRDVPLAPALADALGLPAFLDRDTNIAALGERAFGAAQGEDDFIYLTVSTGVGGAIVTGGELLHGPDGLAGELGHVPVTLDGPRCVAGSGEAVLRACTLQKIHRILVARPTDVVLLLGDPPWPFPSAGCRGRTRAPAGRSGRLLLPLS